MNCKLIEIHLINTFADKMLRIPNIPTGCIQRYVVIIQSMFHHTHLEKSFVEKNCEDDAIRLAP